MRKIKRSAAVLLALGTAFALTPAAGAQEPVKPVFTLGGPSVFEPGAAFTASIKEGTCPGGPVSLTSPGFASVDLATLSGTVATTSTWYTATLKCKDTTETGSFDFWIQEPRTPRTDPFLDKAEYTPGETINIYLEAGWKCFGPATSEGFAAPADLWWDSKYGLGGKTTAGSAPGTYQVTIHCGPTPVINQFTIKAAPATPPPPGSPATKPKPPIAKPQIVKPKGAPQTGGGGTA